MSPTDLLFPSFTAFAQANRLQEGAKGNLAAKLPRILGQGATKASGLDLPPSTIERKSELATIVFPAGITPPPEVLSEIAAAEADVESVRAGMSKPDVVRRFAVDCIRRASGASGQKDGQWYAEHLVLTPRKGGLEWAWCVTPHYPIIDRIPPDSDYVVHAFEAARQKVRELTLPAEAFAKRLAVAWELARAFSMADSDDVLVTDVMKMYQLAGQDDAFWSSPKRLTYKDLPPAAFVVNLIHWRRTSADGGGFEFVPATLHQAHGANARVFYMPMNAEGTEVRPMVFLRRLKREGK